MQIDAVVVSHHGGDQVLGHRRDAHRRRKLDFRDRDAGGEQAIAALRPDPHIRPSHGRHRNRCRDGGAAAAPASCGRTPITARERVERLRLQKRVLEEGERLVGGLKETAGLRLERERDALAGPPLHIDEIGDSLHQIAGHRGDAPSARGRLA